MAHTVCERISNGESLNAVCHDVGMPSRQTIYNWLRERAEFAQQYALARELQVEVFAEQIIDLADGVDASSSADVNKVKLQIDARKWYAAKVSPRKFCDALMIGGSPDLQAVQISLSPAQAYQQMLGGWAESSDSLPLAAAQVDKESNEGEV